MSCLFFFCGKTGFVLPFMDKILQALEMVGIKVKYRPTKKETYLYIRLRDVYIYIHIYIYIIILYYIILYYIILYYIILYYIILYYIILYYIILYIINYIYMTVFRKSCSRFRRKIGIPCVTPLVLLVKIVILKIQVKCSKSTSLKEKWFVSCKKS